VEGILKRLARRQASLKFKRFNIKIFFRKIHLFYRELPAFKVVQYARIGGKLEDFEDHLVKICELVDGPVSGEVTAEDRDGMVEQGRKLAALADFDQVLSLNLISAAEAVAKKQAEEEATNADPEIDALVAARTEAKKAKNWAEADRIRDELKARGIEIIDTPQGAKWRKV